MRKVGLFLLGLILLASTAWAQPIVPVPGPYPGPAYPYRYRLDPYQNPNLYPPTMDPNTANVGRPYNPYYGYPGAPGYDPYYGGIQNNGDSVYVPGR